ncbi:hypothetical protein RJ639_016800 [Escallonia herrerae]|uniref:PHD-type domain-containing protein n=1 Tax=Escallonia herrerae TaxID=1293975 RepID=A0AA88VGY9_9ASTE|nr:hypothetical protein RJ639_016800 [Escallonia herrerae]
MLRFFLQFEGSTPSACWNKVYRRMRKKQFCSSDASMAEGASERVFKSGSDMFGFSHPEVLKLIQESSYSQSPSKSSKLTFARHQGLPVGYRPVHVEWKDLDKCNVCHMDEEYENNLFLQCDKCRMMVHARCYGELEPLNGILWFCNLCRSGAPEFPPPCCLCPVIASTTILSNTCQIVALIHPLDPNQLLFVKAAVSHAVKAKSVGYLRVLHQEGRPLVNCGVAILGQRDRGSSTAFDGRGGVATELESESISVG